MQLGPWELNLEFSSELMFHGVASSLLVHITFPYIPWKMHAQMRRVCDTRLQEHRLVRARNLWYTHHIGGNGRVNLSDDDWDDIWDKPTDQ